MGLDTRRKNKRGHIKTYVESDDNDVTPKEYESQEDSDVEKGLKLIRNKIKIKKKDKQVDIHPENENNTCINDNTNESGASTSRASRRNGTFSNVKNVNENSEIRGRP